MKLKIGNGDSRAQVEALNKSQAVIEFNMDGTITTASENFLKPMGYTLDEVKGKHHSMFVLESERHSHQSLLRACAHGGRSVKGW